MRSDYMALQSNVQESLRQLKSKGLLEKKEEAEAQIAQTRSQIEFIRSKQRELQRRNDDLTRSLSKLKGSIESSVMKAARQSISLSTDD